MNMFSEEIREALKSNGILPVVCLKDRKESDTLIEALLPTPVRCIEITLRHPFAKTAISHIKTHYPSFTVGAGTVLNDRSFNDAVDSGADFCVSPGYDDEMLDSAAAKNIPFLPGCSTPSEILCALKRGFQTLKFFPAECSGGADALKLYQGAFAEMSFIPTGGITKQNLSQYLRCENVLACGGSFMIPKGALVAGDVESIYREVTACLAVAKEVR